MQKKCFHIFYCILDSSKMKGFDRFFGCILWQFTNWKIQFQWQSMTFIFIQVLLWVLLSDAFQSPLCFLIRLTNKNINIFQSTFIVFGKQLQFLLESNIFSIFYRFSSLCLAIAWIMHIQIISQFTLNCIYETLWKLSLSFFLRLIWRFEKMKEKRSNLYATY